MFKNSYFKKEVLVFRRFGGKGYSLFACLGRVVVISVLSVSTLSHAPAKGIGMKPVVTDSLGSATDKELTLEEIRVTGSKAPLTTVRAARMVTVLERAHIKAAPVQSVNDLVKYAAGVDVRQRGAQGMQTDVSIRGGNHEQIAILLNGISISDPQTGHNALDLPVSVSEIERVEVIEGPAGRVYGTSSLVGAINIVTTPKPASSLDVHAEGGSYGTFGAAARANLARGRWNNQLSGGYTRSDGYSRSSAGGLNSDFSGSRMFYQGQYAADGVRVAWHAGVSDKGWGSSTFYATPQWKADDQYEHTTKIFTAVRAEVRSGRFHFRPSVFWNRNADRYEGYRNMPEKMKYNYNRSDVTGIALNAHVDWVAGRTAFGVDFRNEDHVSTNLGNPLNYPQHIAGTDRHYELGINRTVSNAYIEHNVLLDRFTLSAGVVASRNSFDESGVAFCPGADASFRISPDWKLYASFNTSLRVPSYTEMYYKLPGYSANPLLKAEKMTAVEFGAAYSSRGVSAKAGVYHHHGKDMIDWIMDTRMGDAAVWQSVNHTRINSVGVEAAAGFDFAALLPAQNILRRLDLSYHYISQDKALDDGIVSQYALEYLRHKFVASLHLGIWKRLGLSLFYRWQERVGAYTDFEGVAHSYQPYGVLDARLGWDSARCGLYVKANNLLDKSYRDYGNVLQPGLWVMAGVSLNVNL